MSTIKLRENIILHEAQKIAHKPWIYFSVLGMVGFLFLANFVIVPMAQQSYAISIRPITPQAEPGAATASLVGDINAQGVSAESLGYASHAYLPGKGSFIIFAGDNIQIFEYPDNKTAQSEAAAIFKRAPSLVAKSYFHIFLRGNLIGLYMGNNAKVLSITEAVMGAPIYASSSLLSLPT